MVQDTVERLGDSINKIPRDQTAAIPPSTGSTISPCDVSVYPKYLGGWKCVSLQQLLITTLEVYNLYNL